MKEHRYTSTIEWTGNKGSGTYDYRSYSRSHTIKIEDKPDIFGSSDSSFRGEKSRHNPEDLFVASISSCHMLWYLHLCADNDVVVLKYNDTTEGSLKIDQNGGGSFTIVTLKPIVEISKDSSIERALELHEKAHELCFIASSCNFKIAVEPQAVKSN